MLTVIVEEQCLYLLNIGFSLDSRFENYITSQMNNLTNSVHYYGLCQYELQGDGHGEGRFIEEGQNIGMLLYP